MFIRKLKHKNGLIYIQAVEKVNQKYVVRRSFGSARSNDDIQTLVSTAEAWVKNYKGIQELDFENERSLYSVFLSSITSHKLVGIDLVLGKIFDDIGFNTIDDELLKDLVLYRRVYPKSKVKSTEYLHRFAQRDYSEDDIYRYIDKLYSTQKEKVQ